MLVITFENIQNIDLVHLIVHLMLSYKKNNVKVVNCDTQQNKNRAKFKLYTLHEKDPIIH